MKTFRWLMTVPVGVFGWFTGLFAGIFIDSIGKWTCPSEYVVSGNCNAPWSLLLHSMAYVIGASVAACAVVLLPTLMAPTRRDIVALVAFTVGLAFAIYLVILDGPLEGPRDLWIWFTGVPFGFAVLSGVGTVWLICRSNSSLNRTRKSSAPVS